MILTPYLQAAFCLLLIQMEPGPVVRNNSKDFCAGFSAIHTFIAERRQADTSTGHPLAAKRAASIYYPGAKSNKQVIYFKSSIKLPGEMLSEFKVENGKFHYTATLGSYSTTAAADKAGQVLKAKILKCVNTSKWKRTDDPDSYLVMSYLPRDISLALMSYKNDAGRLEIRLTLITFGSL